MPQATNLTIKDAANADVTLTLLSPAAGDGSIATWQLKRGPSPIVYPTLTGMARRTGNGARRAEVKFTYPVGTNPTDGSLPIVTTRAECNISTVVPLTFPEDKRDDFITLATNAFRTSLIQAMCRDGIGAN